ncbi:MAG: hypothetical protein ACF8NJ_08570 [Phycisphaerales bacterium JB038]
MLTRLVLALFMLLLDATAAIVWPPFWPERLPTRYLILFDEVLFPLEGRPDSGVREEFEARQRLGWSDEEERAILSRHFRLLCERGRFVGIRDTWPADRPLRVMLSPKDRRDLDPGSWGPLECTLPYVIEVDCLGVGELAQVRTIGRSEGVPGGHEWFPVWEERVREVPWSIVNDRGELPIVLRAYEQTGSGKAQSPPSPGRLLCEEQVILRVRAVDSVEAAIEPYEDEALTALLRRELRFSYETRRACLLISGTLPLSKMSSRVAVALRLSIESNGEEVAWTRFRVVVDAARRRTAAYLATYEPRAIGLVKDINIFDYVPLGGNTAPFLEAHTGGGEFVVRVSGDGDLALNDPYATHYWDGEFVLPLKIR